MMPGIDWHHQHPVTQSGYFTNTTRQNYLAFLYSRLAKKDDTITNLKLQAETLHHKVPYFLARRGTS